MGASEKLRLVLSVVDGGDSVSPPTADIEKRGRGLGLRWGKGRDDLGIGRRGRLRAKEVSTGSTRRPRPSSTRDRRMGVERDKRGQGNCAGREFYWALLPSCFSGHTYFV